ncbi:MAG: DUF86 domain-containing protein [Cyclobacteriaceae bacterium]
MIGEAVKRILKSDNNFENLISDTKEVVSLRNQVIHAYDNLSDENIWAIIINHLPKLKSEIEKLINEQK